MRLPGLLAAALAAGLGTMPVRAASPARSYYGFDRNVYPGDSLLPALRRSFAFTGYWLSDPPGMASNSWAGKRAILRADGFGFLLLYNGRLDADLQRRDAAALGREDAAAAIAAAAREGFPTGAIVFLDQEQGGALLPEQAAYLGAWIAALNRSRYRAGVYASAIPEPAGPRVVRSTAQDVAARFPQATLWVWDDRCPPSPGCRLPGHSSLAAGPDSEPDSGFDSAAALRAFPRALVWQYAQSPRRPADTRACRATYAADGLCYAPGLPRSPAAFVDLDVSGSPDPSHGR